MHWSKVSSITLVSLFSATLLISLFFSLNSPATSAVKKAPTLAFMASQRQGKTVKNSLFTIKANGSARRELTPTLNNVSPNFTWSPNVSELTDNPQRVNNSEVLWSPDSTRFAYYYTESGGNQIYLLDAKGGTPKNLTPQLGQYFGLHWLANGKQLAYFSHQKLYTINVDDSHSTEKTLQVAPSELSNVAWSSDNQQVAFTSGNAQKSDLYVMNRQGVGLTKLTNNRDLGVYVPAWQP